eukprot:1041468-Rhodomonas_salina.1
MTTCPPSHISMTPCTTFYPRLLAFAHAGVGGRGVSHRGSHRHAGRYPRLLSGHVPGHVPFSTGHVPNHVPLDGHVPGHVSDHVPLVTSQFALVTPPP